MEAVYGGGLWRGFVEGVYVGGLCRGFMEGVYGGALWNINENKHSTSVEFPPPPRACMSIRPECQTCFKLGSCDCSWCPSCWAQSSSSWAAWTRRRGTTTGTRQR